MVFLKTMRHYLWAWITLSMLSTPVYSDEKPLVLYEQKIKAGLVYNLIKYTVWPETLTNKKLNVCLFGGDPFEGYLSPLEGRTAQQVVISIHKIDKIIETKSCHLLIIHQDQNNQLPELLEFLHTENILTVSDIKEFSTHGGMVELAKENEKINIYINNTTVTKNGLKIDDRMLKLAKIVSGKEGA